MEFEHPVDDVHNVCEAFGAFGIRDAQFIYSIFDFYPTLIHHRSSDPKWLLLHLVLALGWGEEDIILSNVLVPLIWIARDRTNVLWEFTQVGFCSMLNYSFENPFKCP